MARILMCPPDFYGIEYEINPWMQQARQADHEEAAGQWKRLKSLLESLGATIELLAPVEGLPDLVFTANAALIFKNRAILSRFRHKQRQGEERHNASWLAKAGFIVESLEANQYFEGAGDALFCGDTLFAGYRIRSDAVSQQRVGSMTNSRVIPVELVNPRYYHLDTCFCPLAEGIAAWHPDAFDDYGRRVIGEHIETLIAVEAEEAQSFACNAVVVEKNVVTNIGCPQFHEKLKSLGFSPHATPLGEFVKAGGSAKCLTLRLDGEQAAGWRK